MHRGIHRWMCMGMVALGFSGMSGCGRSKVEECNALVGALKPGIDDIHTRIATLASNPTDLAQFKGLADAADKVAEEGAKVEVRAPELQKFSSDYQRTMKEFSKTARQVSEASNTEAGKMNSAADELERIGKEEKQLVEDMNKFCQAP